MRYLVTGGTGFIGSHLAEHLLRRGHAVIALDDLSTGRRENVRSLRRLDGRFHFVQGSAADPTIVEALVSRCDAVFHLAAALGVHRVLERPLASIRTTIHTAEVVLAAANRFRRPVLITSSSEVYGKLSRTPFSEDDDVIMGSTRHSRWCYAYSKGISEFLALAYHRQFALPTIIVRLFNTVGPGQVGTYGMVLPRFVSAALKNEPLQVYGDGTQTRCFCHVSDVVRALVRLLEQRDATAGETFNVGSDEEVSMNELARRVVELTGSRSAIVHVPYEQAYGCGFDEMLRRVPKLEKIRSVIDFRPRFNLDQIIRSLVKDNHRLVEPEQPRATPSVSARLAAALRERFTERIDE